MPGMRLCLTGWFAWKIEQSGAQHDSITSTDQASTAEYKTAPTQHSATHQESIEEQGAARLLKEMIEEMREVVK